MKQNKYFLNGKAQEGFYQKDIATKSCSQENKDTFKPKGNFKEKLRRLVLIEKSMNKENSPSPNGPKDKKMKENTPKRRNSCQKHKENQPIKANETKGALSSFLLSSKCHYSSPKHQVEAEIHQLPSMSQSSYYTLHLSKRRHMNVQPFNEEAEEAPQKRESLNPNQNAKGNSSRKALWTKETPSQEKEDHTRNSSNDSRNPRYLYSRALEQRSIEAKMKERSQSCLNSQENKEKKQLEWTIKSDKGAECLNTNENLKTKRRIRTNRKEQNAQKDLGSINGSRKPKKIKRKTGKSQRKKDNSGLQDEKTSKYQKKTQNKSAKKQKNIELKGISQQNHTGFFESYFKNIRVADLPFQPNDLPTKRNKRDRANMRISPFPFGNTISLNSKLCSSPPPFKPQLLQFDPKTIRLHDESHMITKNTKSNISSRTSHQTTETVTEENLNESFFVQFSQSPEGFLEASQQTLNERGQVLARLQSINAELAAESRFMEESREAIEKRVSFAENEFRMLREFRISLMNEVDEYKSELNSEKRKLEERKNAIALMREKLEQRKEQLVERCEGMVERKLESRKKQDEEICGLVKEFEAQEKLKEDMIRSKEIMMKEIEGKNQESQRAANEGQREREVGRNSK